MIIDAIRDIGKLVDKPQLPKIDGKVIVIAVNSNSNNVEKEMYYSGISIEDFDSEKLEKYLFKEGSSKGNKPAPFCPITEPSKSFEKIEKWFKKCLEIDSIEANDKQLINNIVEIFRVEKEKIITDIRKEVDRIDKKISKFLTIKLDNQYLGEYQIFEKCMKQLEDVRRERSVGRGTCSICGMSEVKVSGKSDIFKFYTIDKPGFITGGFREEHAWKNYPVCFECEKQLERGRKFIEDNLKFEFYKLKYWLIPRLLVGDEYLLKIVISILSDTSKRIELKEKVKKKITNDENEILEYLAQQDDNLTLNFLFIQKQQSAERILLLIEDVFPSRIREIFKTKSEVDEIFQEEYNFGKLRRFFSKSTDDKRENDLDKYFLELTNSVFIGKRVEFSFLLKFFMDVIRKEFHKYFVNDGYFMQTVRDALMNVIFLEKLALVSFEEVYMDSSFFDSIFKKYGKSFNNPVRRGIFLLGALTQLLLNKQWMDRNAKPFMKNLKGLRLDEKDIKSLLSKIQNKFEEYESFDKGKMLIAAEISKYLLDAGDNWKMSVDEINFYFTCGMNLASEVAEIVYSENIIKKEV